MVLLLGQLLYTQFPQVEDQALASAAIPREIQQAFIEQIVQPFREIDHISGANYRAVYLYRAALDHTLFGWLYYDRGERNVPYFLCYYFAGWLSAAHLDVIFTCLSTGPVHLFDRQHPFDRLPSVVIEDYQNYRPARSGVVIPSEYQAKSHLALQQQKLFKLFVPELEYLAQGASIAPPAIEAPAAPSRRSPRSAQVWWFGISGTIALIALVAGSTYLFQRLPMTSNSMTSNSMTSNSMTASPNSTALPTATPDRQPLTLEKTLTPHSAAVWSVILSSDGQTLFSGSADRTIKIWNLETGTLLHTLTGHQDVPRSLALTPDQTILISGSGDRTIKLWDLPTYQLRQTLEQSSPVWSVAVSPDGETLFSGNGDGILTAWNLQTGALLYEIPAHPQRIFSVAISPDGHTIATASLDGTLKLWNAQTRTLLRTITEHTSAVRALAFSPDGQILASASWDRTVKLWHPQTGALIHSFSGHRSRVVAIAFSADGQTLVSGSIDNTIKRWSVSEGVLLQTLADATDWVLSIAVDSRHLVGGSKDKTIRVWRWADSP